MNISMQPHNFKTTGTVRQPMLDGNNMSRWFYTPRPLERPLLRLYCFPYAGGGASVFREWPALLPDRVELQALTLPGRGALSDERPVSDLRLLSRQIATLVTLQTDVPFAFFGHSMGAMLAFETARELRRRGAKLPVHLFLSACHAAHRFGEGRITVEDMNDEEFIRHLSRLAGTPATILDDQRLMETLLPMLKADFMALDRWRYVADRPLQIPITAIHGREDTEVQADGVCDWQRHTNTKFNFTTVAGNHFFIQNSKQAVVRLIVNSLEDDAWL